MVTSGSLLAVFFVYAWNTSQASLSDTVVNISKNTTRSERSWDNGNASGLHLAQEKSSRRSSHVRVINGCHSEPIWIAHCCGYDYRTNVKIEPGGSHNFPAYAGLTGFRLWPKMRLRDPTAGCVLVGCERNLKLSSKMKQWTSCMVVCWYVSRDLVFFRVPPLWSVFKGNQNRNT